MKRRILSVAVLAVLFTMVSVAAHAGCYINIKATNSGHEQARLYNNSKVKSKGGTWRNVFYQTKYIQVVSPGKSYIYVYKSTFGCKKPRQYQFLVRVAEDILDRKDDCKQSFHIPANVNAYTTSTDIDLGDLARFSCAKQEVLPKKVIPRVNFR